MALVNTFLHCAKRISISTRLCCERHHSSFLKWEGIKKYVKMHPDVQKAILNKKPVVALESTIITHGMPYPKNYETALEVEEIVKGKSVVPATIAIIDGYIHVGISEDELRTLSSSKSSIKISRRGMSASLAFKQTGGTTVSATMMIAHKCGIPIFVTGGIGGVHRGVENTMDISSDLTELGRTPVTVISAGVKSILDIPRTLEYLETQGVTVATFGENNDFPSFFTPKSGCKSQTYVQSPEDAAKLIKASQDLNMDSGCLIAVPIPSEYAASGEKIESAIKKSLSEAKAKSISGADVTPYILERVNQLTEGESLQANVALIKHNASVGSEIALALSGYCSSNQNFMPPSSSGSMIKKDRPIVIGATNIDVVAKCDGEVMLDGPSNPATINYALGGVGRNIAEGLARYGDNPIFISALGDDGHAVMAENELKDYLDLTYVQKIPSCGSGLYNAIMDNNGSLRAAAEMMGINDRMDVDAIKKYEDLISQAPIVCVDANIPTETLHYICDLCNSAKVNLFFEPTGSLKAARPFDSSNCWKSIKYMSPNIQEFEVIISAVTGENRKIDLNENGKFADKTLKSILSACRPLLEHVYCLIVTLAGKGVAIFVQDDSVSTGVRAVHYPLTEIPEFKFLSLPAMNVSGSGDAFAAAFLHGIMHKKSLDICTKMGLIAAQYSLRSSSAVPKTISANLFKEIENYNWPRNEISL